MEKSVSQEVIVGVLTCGLEEKYFSNGLHQNGLYLYRCLKKAPGIKPLLIYYPITKELEESDSMIVFGETAHNIEKFYEKYHLDVLIMVSNSLGPNNLARLKKNKVRIVSAVYGNRYVMDQETMCFGDLLPPTEKFVNYAARSLLREDSFLDAVWVSPHFAWQKDYIKHRYNAKQAHVCPYIWSPELFLGQYEAQDYWQKNDMFFHKGNPNNKNVFCTEPNVNVLKTSLFAYQAVNALHERENEELDVALLFGSRRAALHNKNFIHYTQSLPIGQTKKVYFEGRWRFSVITKHAQVMFHHHFMNGLNYTLLEAALLGLPVVHNSEFMPELGYYYKGANLTQAVDQLEKALLHEDREDLEEYKQTALGVVQKFMYDEVANIRGYQTLIANLIKPSIEPELPGYIVDLENKIQYGDGHISPLT